MRGGGRWSVGACCGFDTGFVAWFLLVLLSFVLGSAVGKWVWVLWTEMSRAHTYLRSIACRVGDKCDAQDRIETVASA